MYGKGGILLVTLSLWRSERMLYFFLFTLPPQHLNRTPGGMPCVLCCLCWGTQKLVSGSHLGLSKGERPVLVSLEIRAWRRREQEQGGLSAAVGTRVVLQGQCACEGVYCSRGLSMPKSLMSHRSENGTMKLGMKLILDYAASGRLCW